MNTIYLASGSPRRREILTNLGYTVIRLNADIDETPHPNEQAQDYVLRMACEKNATALRCWQTQNNQSPEYPILTADTTVALGSTILGKPESAEQAKKMLHQLSDAVHQVLTAVCVYWQDQTLFTVQQSNVRFKSLTDVEIDAYIANGEPMDKAGAYGIQGIGGVFVADLQGSFTGVMGLPVFETVQLLQQHGLVVPPFSSPDKAV